jgi:DNA-binding LacI/PurR family transcriptional regulator
MATIKDVAARASVSIATVSRIINQKGKYTKETETLVLKAAEELGYIPNLTAKSLKTGLTGTIAIVIHEFFLINYPVLLATAIAVLQREDYNAQIIANADLGDCIRLLHTGKFDGLLIVGIKNEEHALRNLIGSGSNFVVLGEGIEREDVNVVEIDYFQGGYVATQHLINFGHENILFIEDNEDLSFTQEIKRGYLFALDENGIQYKEQLLVRCGGMTGELNGYSTIKDVVRETDFSAVLTTDDRIAYGSLKALKEEGYTVPKDRSIIGFGDLSCSAYIDPPITSVEIPFSQTGELGAEILVNNIKRKDSIVKRVKLQVRLVPRKTHSKKLT